MELSKTYEPKTKNRAIYYELYHEFLNVYKNNKRSYARLNALG